MKSNKLTFITPPWWPIKQKANILQKFSGKQKRQRKLLKIKKSKIKDIFSSFRPLFFLTKQKLPKPTYLRFPSLPFILNKRSLWRNISKISFTFTFLLLSCSVSNTWSFYLLERNYCGRRFSLEVFYFGSHLLYVVMVIELLFIMWSRQWKSLLKTM